MTTIQEFELSRKTIKHFLQNQRSIITELRQFGVYRVFSPSDDVTRIYVEGMYDNGIKKHVSRVLGKYNVEYELGTTLLESEPPPK